MLEKLEDTFTKLVEAVNSATDVNDRASAVKDLKLFAEANDLLEPDPDPDPEPTGFKAWCDRHSEALIKAGATLTTVGLIAVLEAKWDVIFRSKGSKLI